MFDPTEGVGVGVHGIAEGEAGDQAVQELPEAEAEAYWGNHFWARGYFVSTVGVDEEMSRRYVRYQEDRERQEERQRKGFDLLEDPSTP